MLLRRLSLSSASRYIFVLFQTRSLVVPKFLPHSEPGEGTETRFTNCPLTMNNRTSELVMLPPDGLLTRTKSGDKPIN